MSDEFGFTVSVAPEDDGAGGVRDRWTVDLPHQCDSWTIAIGDKATVAEGLRAFIAEATEALARLERGEVDEGVVCAHEWEPTDQTLAAHRQRLWQCTRCRRLVWRPA